VLSDHEQRVWDEIERELTAEGRGPGGAEGAGRRHRRRDGHHPAVRAVLVAVGSIAVLLLISGAVSAALALAAATALGWLLWRCWPQLRDDAAVTLPAQTCPGTALGGTTRRPGAEWLSRYLKRISEVE
jgi:hypothetical protein